MKKFFILTLLFALLLACNGGDDVRSYTEKNVIEKNGERVSERTTKPELRRITWKTPPGWTEKESRGIRLATFDIRSGQQHALCTIVPLQGDGGGVKANVLRWLAQLDLKMDSEEALDEFVLKQKRFTTFNKIPATLIDFSPLAQSAKQQAMMALILRLSHETVFIKMIGEKTMLVKNREKLISLGNSLRIIRH